MGQTGIDRPVDVARLLTEIGLSLGDAHQALQRLTSGANVDVALDRRQLAAFRDKLRGLGITVHLEQPAVREGSASR